MNLAELIQGLQHSLGIDPLEPDEDGTYAVVFDGNLDIEILLIGSSELLIRSRLATVPDDEQEQETLYREYLQHSLMNLRDQDASISLDAEADAKTLWLYRMQRIDRLDVQQFCQMVENFVNTLEWWQQFDQPSSPQMPMGQFPFNNMLRP